MTRVNINNGTFGNLTKVWVLHFFFLFSPSLLITVDVGLLRIDASYGEQH